MPHELMQKDPDIDLVKAVGEGDAAALRRMVERKLPRVLSLARHVLGDAAEAEDVAQETFLRIWRHAPKWKPGQARFDTWMHRVTLNLCYDRLRKRRERPMALPPEQVDEGPLPDAHLLGQDSDERRMQAALQRIAPRQREAIVLVYYQDLSNRDAAEAMNITVEALESLLSRGRRSLQGLLQRDDEDLDKESDV
ncbi:RNA polymerase sigma factor [Rhizobium paknamense]|uniref:RNA polymerase sigma-70 factor (ECF subfamily) n=1 Tax=Rhizobium paknamense TaxID=1206817 RepID=A0ABU0IGQ6_9HYPH|nr:RNA polymerase sigma factor [Rhizobium paknamense]MDQ0456399.1 RNA polymerase sigma-70 factor (ECF subfamily) [Rhizobium paknamense]